MENRNHNQNPEILAEDEAAAQAFQEVLWLEGAAENEEVHHHLNNIMPDFVRQLFREQRHQQQQLEDRAQNHAGNQNGVGAVAAAEAAAEAVRQAFDAVAAENPARAAAVMRQALEAVGEDPVMDVEALDAGVAGEVFDESGTKITKAVKCPLLLYLENVDDLDGLSPGNKYLRRGMIVYIGLDKTTKLFDVFQQYCNIINKESSRIKEASILHYVKPSDFDFTHCSLLDPSFTVEASAMMKNDRIKVSRERSKERCMKAELVRQQRESDRKYFKDLRQLLPNSSPDFMRGCDIILDCRGKVVDEWGYSQNVLATTVRANSVILSKRCKWLGQKIFYAREDLRRKALITVPPESEMKDQNEATDDENKVSHQLDNSSILINVHHVHKSSQSDDEDCIVPSFPGQVGMEDNVGEENHHIAAAVEDDEDYDTDILAFQKTKLGKNSALISHNTVCVTLDHSPEAVKLLLEYCYTNRVYSLGHTAFIRASRFMNPRDSGLGAAIETGPVSPFRKHEWPNGGIPSVSLQLAIAGIALAEEAHMPRLSLMCEIAASQLVNQNNVLDVLSACRLQQQKTGNRLSLLRKAAMLDCIYPNGSIGIDRLMEKPHFKTCLEEKSTLVVPSLLEATVELLPTTLAFKDWQIKKEMMVAERNLTFILEDNADKSYRELERNSRRSMAVVKRRINAAFGSCDNTKPERDFYENPLPVYYHRSSKRKSQSLAYHGERIWHSSQGL